MIVVLPAARLVANPVELMVATEVEDELHKTLPVTVLMEPSEYVPVAVNCCVAPAVTEGDGGATAIETNVTTGALTVRSVLPLTVPLVAVMVAVPAATLRAIPVELTVATEVEDELQVEVEETSLVVPSLKCPVAVNC